MCCWAKSALSANLTGNSQRNHQIPHSTWGRRGRKLLQCQNRQLTDVFFFFFSLFFFLLPVLPHKQAVKQNEREKSYNWLRAMQYFLILATIIKGQNPSVFSYTSQRFFFGGVFSWSGSCRPSSALPLTHSFLSVFSLIKINAFSGVRHRGSRKRNIQLPAREMWCWYMPDGAPQKVIVWLNCVQWIVTAVGSELRVLPVRRLGRALPFYAATVPQLSSPYCPTNYP